MFVIPFDETKSGGQIYMWARKTLHYSQMQTFNLQATWLDGGCVGVPTFFDNYIEGDKRLEKTWYSIMDKWLVRRPTNAAQLYQRCY